MGTEGGHTPDNRDIHNQSIASDNIRVYTGVSVSLIPRQWGRMTTYVRD